jgi:hypothetical protein
LQDKRLLAVERYFQIKLLTILELKLEQQMRQELFGLPILRLPVNQFMIMILNIIPQQIH